jgi:hypothetical protein
VAIKLKIDSKIEKDRVALKHLSMIDWLFTVLRPAQEFFTYMTSPLPVKGCKI